MGGFEWNRQVLLVRSPKVTGPNYVLLRDTTAGGGKRPSWWYQWLVTRAEDVTPIPGGVRAALGEDILLDVVFLQPENPKVTVKDTRVKRYKEDYCQLSVSRAADEAGGYFVLFYPYKRGEPAPHKVEMPAEGVARVVTAEWDDYVFAGADAPVKFKGGGVEIEGNAGMVRVGKDSARLVNASIRPASLSAGGAAKAAVEGPWEYEVRGGKLSPMQPEVPVVTPAKPERGQVTEAGAEGVSGWIAVEGDTVTLVAARGSGVLGHKEFRVVGEAPYTCVWKPGEITLTALGGRRRVFLMPTPANLVPPALIPPAQRGRALIDWPPDVKVDGHSVQAGWSGGWIAVGLEGGGQSAVIRPYANPPVWPGNAWTRLLPVPPPK